MVFSKRTTPGHDLSCSIWKDSSFPPKTWYFFPGRKARVGLTLSRNTWKHEMFYLICSMPPPAKKIQRRSYPAKIHVMVIDIPDRHPRKISSTSLYLHGDLYRRFHILLSSKKNRQLII